MHGFELELQRQRNQRLQTEADTHRMVNPQQQSAASDIRRALGQQLVKLGTRLQGDTQSAQTLVTA